ncbi:MAG TPA: FkbM family methyltransferase, partial [Lacibacter sp.]|nr:FkbM family methyltransferase [Lacibacter sp.]
MKRYMNGKEFVATISAGPAKGLVFPVKLPQDKYMWIGTWEVEFANALQQYVQPGWVCYDIGGYKGYYAGVMALKGAKEVYVFEPMPGNAEKIHKLMELNPSLSIHLQQYAVSDSNGTATFKLMPEETMGKLENSSFQKEDVEVNSITVATITLDSFVEQGVPAPDFIKIDVEGAEEFVLKGASRTLAQKKPFLMIEIHSPEIGKRCLEVLQQYYHHVHVLETGKAPDGSEAAICHYVAYA